MITVVSSLYDVKPCPMCGGDNIYVKISNFNFLYTAYINCSKCGLQGFKNFTNKTDIDTATKEVIKYWNTRNE